MKSAGVEFLTYLFGNTISLSSKHFLLLGVRARSLLAGVVIAIDSGVVAPALEKHIF